MPRDWAITVRGGAYDGWDAETSEDPAELLVLWRCSSRCDGHATFDTENPSIMLRTAEVYRRVELDPGQRIAVYELETDDPRPEVEEFAGAGLGGGIPA